MIIKYSMIVFKNRYRYTRIRNTSKYLGNTVYISKQSFRTTSNDVEKEMYRVMQPYTL